ncbi:MAG: Unknown protein [uncultured Thiotrichaceae bacterium]|uniref:Uncharacterized protein n=1 Tax=uncultured Thiotrichaceae bacterium TaxID=298394 RepID=A0A6S6TX70_9GAMM|nr:MAG: Unknown protein [uncultured Thiotrichaceae bacterium]
MDALNSLNPVADAIMRWGPAGIAAVLMLFAERRLKDRWQTAPENAHTVMKWLYVGNWLFIAAMLTIVTILWVQRETATNSAIVSKGYIANVPDNVGVYSRENFYQRLTTKGNPFSPTNEIEWHFTNSTPLDKRIFTVQAPDGNTVREYFISSDLDYADEDNIELIYRRHPQEVFRLQYRAIGNGFKTLKPIPITTNIFTQRDLLQQNIISQFFFNDLFAADVTYQVIEEALESKNPYRRRDAAQYLSEHKTTYFSDIDASLQQNQLSENQLSGILSALGHASNDQQSSLSLSEDAKQTVFESLFHESTSIQKQAQWVYMSNLDKESVIRFNEKCTHINALPDDLSRERCAYIGMSLFYHLGITSVIGVDDVAIATIRDAIGLMEPSTTLWKHASPDQQIHHGKLLYGLGLLFEQLAQAYEKENLTEEAEKARNNASIYFSNFLTFLDEHPSETEIYYYCWHINQAQCYVKKPGQTCIDNNPVIDCNYATIAIEETLKSIAVQEEKNDDAKKIQPESTNKDLSKPPVFETVPAQ